MSVVEELFHDLLQMEALALLSDYGVALAGEEIEAPDMNIIATIGFSSDVLQGSLGLVFNEALLITLTRSALGGMEPGRDMQRDWLGELANQLLGRMKRTLLDYSVEISLSTPIVLRGMRIQLLSQGDSTGHISLTSCEGGAWVCFDLRHEPDFALIYSPPPEDEEALDDGMALFF